MLEHHMITPEIKLFINVETLYTIWVVIKYILQLFCLKKLYNVVMYYDKLTYLELVRLGNSFYSNF